MKRNMQRLARWSSASIVASALVMTASSANANDNMFQSAPAAQSAIKIDGKGFLINGKRTFIASGGIEYARVPRALWRDRLLRFKRAGLNCIEIYTFWNYHEAYEGQFNFSGNHDLDAFLKLAKSLGLYAIVRVGPYYCAEWDSGGYPIWLRFQPGVRVREDNSQFEKFVDRFWKKLIPVVAANQINRGGNVILVQLENEDPEGWGTETPNGYFTHLQRTALSLGLQVPYLFSGANHGNDPAAGQPWDSIGRTSPWFTTEFWSNWFTRYGQTHEDLVFDRRTWKIIAYGGNGYNYYMFHGGTNFDYYRDPNIAASYDYGAAVGQAGDLRPTYYRFKRAAWFARSFQSILENSTNATDSYRQAATDAGVAVTARQSPSGTILFLDNSGSAAVKTQVRIGETVLPTAGSITLNAKEIMPVVTDFPLSAGVMLKWAPVRVFGIVQQGNTQTIVIYGQPGTPAELTFTAPPGTTIDARSPELSFDNAHNPILRARFSEGDTKSYSFSVGGQRIRILAVSDSLVDDTWFVESANQNYVVVGPQYVADVDVQNDTLRMSAETPWQGAQTNPTSAYGQGDTPIRLSEQNISGLHPAPPSLGHWQVKSAIAPVAPRYDDSKWLTKAEPQPMGADGDIGCYAWYRSSLNVPTAGQYDISMASPVDRMIPYVDGVAIPSSNVHASSFTVDLGAGSHSLTIFTSHLGRPDLYAYIGPIDHKDQKGIVGPVYLERPSEAPTQITMWNMMPTDSSAVHQAPPTSNASGWTAYKAGTDAFHGNSGWAWFQRTLPQVASRAIIETIHFDGIDDNGWIYLNGKLLTSHSDWSSGFDVRLDDAWSRNGPNTLTVLVQNTSGPGSISNSTFSAYNYRAKVTNWRLHGGAGDPDNSSGWQTLSKGAQFSGPRFFQSHFVTHPFSVPGPYPIFRIKTEGLSYGSVWVNGHNLGRYPERIAAPGTYIPECWLISGINTLVIYDEDGNRPDQVTIQIEESASRNIVRLQSATKLDVVRRVRSSRVQRSLARGEAMRAGGRKSL